MMDQRDSEDNLQLLPEEDPILRLRGLGKEIWGDEHPDEYVRRLREGW